MRKLALNQSVLAFAVHIPLNKIPKCWTETLNTAKLLNETKETNEGAPKHRVPEVLIRGRGLGALSDNACESQW